MSAPLAVPPCPARPPALALARKHYALAAAAACLVPITWSLGSNLAPLGVTFALGALQFFRFGTVVGRDAWGAAHAAAALQALTRGRFDEVEVHHARVPARSMRRGTVARAVAVQKALLALFRGAPDDAVAAIAPALEARTRGYTYSVERMQQASGYGVRALAHAMKGDAARAEADAQAAESFAEALPEALARARLARVMLVARGGDMTALASLLARDGSLLLEHTMPRERALVRALRKMARGHRRGVYREPSKPSDGGNEPGALAGWIARVAPEAAAYASTEETLAPRAEVSAAPVASPAAVAAMKRARREAARSASDTRGRARRAGAVLGLLACGAIGSAVAFGSFVTGAAATDGVVEGALPPLFDPFLTVLCASAVFFVAFALRRQLARSREYNLATIGGQRAAALGDVEKAEALLAQSKRASLPLFGAAAGAALAALAERRADFACSIRECDAAIAKIGSSHALAEQLLPTLLTTRGVALAAAGRTAEALAELAMLVQAHPHYAHLALADLRIRLVAAVKSGDLVEARRVARQRTAELPIPLRDDLLADLVLAVGERGLPRSEMERLDGELRDDPVSRTWIEAVAPGLRTALEEEVHGRGRGHAEPLFQGDHDEHRIDERGPQPEARRATLDP